MSVPSYTDADVIIVDGRNALWRATYANTQLGYEGEHGWQPTGGVYGFLETVLAIGRRAKDARIVVAWEGAKENRRAIVPGYKVRKPDPKREELFRAVARQESILKGLLSHTAFDSVRAPDWEADDAMGALALAGLRQRLRVAILTTDADLFQCLAEPGDGLGWVRMVRPTKGVNVVWSAETFAEDWGVTPGLVPDVKALAGDTSDCYKGCPGIGDVWARRIVGEHGQIDDVMLAAESGVVCGSEKKAELIVKHRDQILDCLDVAIINTEAPTHYTEGTPDRVALVDAITKLRFHSLRGAHHVRRMLQ